MPRRDEPASIGPRPIQEQTAQQALPQIADLYGGL
jgi:hypothetical protein